MDQLPLDIVGLIEEFAPQNHEYVKYLITEEAELMLADLCAELRDSVPDYEQAECQISRELFDEGTARATARLRKTISRLAIEVMHRKATRERLEEFLKLSHRCRMLLHTAPNGWELRLVRDQMWVEHGVAVHTQMDRWLCLHEFFKIDPHDSIMARRIRRAFDRSTHDMRDHHLTRLYRMVIGPARLIEPERIHRMMLDDLTKRQISHAFTEEELRRISERGPAKTEEMMEEERLAIMRKVRGTCEW